MALSLQHVLVGRAINVFCCRSSWSAHRPFSQVCSDCSASLSKNFFELVDCRGLVHECKQLQTGENEKDSKSLHRAHLTTPSNQSRSNSAQSLQVVATHICVRQKAETDRLLLCVIDVLEDLEPELTLCQQRKSFPFVLFS